jgi:putative flippase GtrA
MVALPAIASSPAARFVAGGAFNTLATWLVYLVLLQWTHYSVAYTCAYALGIVLAYGLNRYLVFRRAGGRLGPLLVAAIYIGQYFAGIALVALWIRGLGGPEAFAPLFAVAVTLPITFLLNRLVFRGRPDAGKA